METQGSTKKARGGKGEPPPDGREWISIDDVAAKLQVTRQQAHWVARRYAWTTTRKHPCRAWVLKDHFDSYLWFIRSCERWYKRGRPQAWREEVCSDFDEETCRRIFWTAQQAALYMQVNPRTIWQWGRKGKIPIFVTRKKGRGGRNWYSPASLRTLREDLEHLQQRAEMKKARETMKAGIVARQVYKQQHSACTYRKPIPPG